MTKTFDFLYDFASPFCYLTHKVLHDIEARTAAKAAYKPILLGGIFKATGNTSPALVPQKLAYQQVEITRFLRRHDLVFHYNPHFPVTTLRVMRGAVYAVGKPYEKLYRESVFNAMWVEGRNMDDLDTIFEVLAAAGLPAAEIIEGTNQSELKGALITATQNAVDRGAFGLPTLYVGNEMFFGKDALPDLEQALRALDSK
mgnify:CR=1 FL=1